MHKEYAARRSLGFRSIYRARQLFFILLLPLIWLVVFKYAPMVGVQIAFRDKDPNGNGIQDEIPMSGASGFSGNGNPVVWLQNLFIYCDTTDNRYLPLSETDGKIDVSYDKEEYREFLKYIHMLVQEELLDEACFTQSLTELRAQLQADTETIGMMFGSANGFGNNIASWQPLEQPIGADGKRTVSTVFSDFEVKTSITADCEHPEIAFLFCMMGYIGDEYVITARQGELGVDWEYSTDPTAVSVFPDMGITPNIREINNVWVTPTNKNWQGISVPGLYSENTLVAEFDGNELYGERLHGRSVAMNYQYAPDYADIVKKLVYTPEESDQWSEIRSSLHTYVAESTSLFAIGQLDPNSDKDWNAYLEELNTLQYKEMLEVDNAAFARMNGTN